MRLLLAALLAAATLCGCSDPTIRSIDHSGVVGETLRGPSGLQVQVVRYLPHVRARRDVTGLGTPLPRTHFAAFKVRVCVATLYLPTIGTANFHLALSNGAEAKLKSPETVYADDLGLLGESGCERGHVLFQVPRGQRPTALGFNLDWAVNNGQGFTDRTRLRFHWTL